MIKTTNKCSLRGPSVHLKCATPNPKAGRSFPSFASFTDSDFPDREIPVDIFQ
jgi:hypothetical protein